MSTNCSDLARDVSHTITRSERSRWSSMGNSVARVNGTAYKILGTLGEGGSATVYEVHRRSDKRHFALKWVRGVREADVLERLLLEIQVHRRLRHANILPLVDAEVRECEVEEPPSSSQSASHHDRVAAAPGATQRAKEVLVVVPICAHGSLQTLLNDASQKGLAIATCLLLRC